MSIRHHCLSFRPNIIIDLRAKASLHIVLFGRYF